MTDREMDRLLRRVLLDAVQQDSAQPSGPDFAPSRRHQRQMRAMLRDPTRWVARRGRPVSLVLLQRAAMFALVTVLSLASVVSAVPSARAAMIRWAEEWAETFVIFRHSGDDDNHTVADYEITELPTGFYEEEREHLDDAMVMVSYTDGNGNYIDFTYARMTQGGATGIDWDESEDTMTEVTVKHMKGWLWKSSEEDGNDTLTWIDSKNDIQFTIVDFNRKSIDVLHMAESVKLVKTPN